jgi:hypothetical protein
LVGKAKKSHFEVKGKSMCVIVLLSITEECTSERVVATCTLTASGFSFSEISTLL